MCQRWQELGPIEQFPPGTQRCLTSGGRSILLLNIQGRLYALNNICPHAGLPFDAGRVNGHVLTCPHHGYAYDVRTGRNVVWPHDEPPARPLPLRVQQGKVQIMLEPDEKKKQPDRPDPEKETPSRGPAPEDSPDRDEPCQSQSDEGDAGKPEDCPEGYPDRSKQ